MLRRPPESILVAHRMDRGRRELYVEGTRDRAFLTWLAEGDLADKSEIIPIDLVDLPDVQEGGNRERLKDFLSIVESSGYDVRGLIDADQGRLIAETVPSNAWLTDLRDIEGYVLTVENIEAALRLGCGIVAGEIQQILNSTFEAAIYLAAVRLASHRLGLRLPVSKSELRGCVNVSRIGTINFNRRRCLTSLLQSAHISLGKLDAVEDAVAAAMTELMERPRIEVVHGKDCMKLLTRQFRGMGASNLADAAPLVWTSSRREVLIEFPVLRQVIEYLKRT
jgi:hypothetical protein